jgi:amidohydrolase
LNIAQIKKLSQELSGEVTETRRYLHAHPEVSWKEIETSRYIERRLTELGLRNIKRGFGGTEIGVTADLTGEADGPTVALRSDIDALPVVEENDVAYRSCNTGAMHACGHDGHMSVLLGTAKVLSLLKSEIKGNIRFIFQPAEEIGLPSGAQVMIDDGVLEGVSMIGGMHIWSFVRTGIVQWRNGPVMASSDRFNVKFTGKGGHGAMPHLAVDPITAAANYVSAIQTIASRELNPTDTAVVSIGKLEAGETFNIIPNTADIIGTLRSFTPEVRSSQEERLRRMADGIASAYRCTAETSVTYLLPSVVNHPEATEMLREAATLVADADNVEESDPLMVSEDFSFYLEKIPGTFFFVGAGNETKGTDYPHHSPHFNLDEDALVTGVAVMSSFALSAIEKLR